MIIKNQIIVNYKNHKGEHHKSEFFSICQSAVSFSYLSVALVKHY